MAFVFVVAVACLLKSDAAVQFGVAFAGALMSAAYIKLISCGHGKPALQALAIAILGGSVVASVLSLLRHCNPCCWAMAILAVTLAGKHLPATRACVCNLVLGALMLSSMYWHTVWYSLTAFVNLPTPICQRFHWAFCAAPQARHAAQSGGSGQASLCGWPRRRSSRP